ncbi:DUF4238 domain-containing protein [Viridibacillus arvi]|uniref:DUF4238 domain-containing protein n=1 Tax=Viridibacillus arvi TaxID=263475 RepID=UPI0034CEEDFC
MKQFDPSWTSNSEKHHLVPNTYLKGWQHTDSKVYYIDKNENQIDFTNQNFSKNTRKINRVDNFYSRRVGALFQSKLDCDKYFAPLKQHGYTVKIDGVKVSNSIELNKNFYNYDKWGIYDVHAKLISEDDKKSLKEKIKSIHIRDLEEAWNQLYENPWPSVRNDIVTEINRNIGVDKIPSVRREDLVKFMVSIEWRTEPAPQLLKNNYNKIVKLLGIEDILKDPIPDEDKMYPFINTYGDDFLHNYLLKQYYDLFNNTGPIYKSAQNICNTMNLELLIPETGYEFITSDNPVFPFLNKNNDTEYIFPITPDLACAVRKGNPVDKEHYFLTSLNKNEVFAYNEQIKKGCNKGYILRQPSISTYFNQGTV